MENLPINVLRELVAARGLVSQLTKRPSRVQLLQLLIASTPAQAGPFGVDLTAPRYEQTLQLRLIPLTYLVRELQQQGRMPSLLETPTYQDAIRAIVGPLDSASEDVLTYYGFPIERLRFLSGSGAPDKVSLIRQLIQRPPNSQLAQGGSALSELTRAGFTVQPLVARALQPLPSGFSFQGGSWTADQLLAAVQQGYDVSSLLPVPPGVPNGTLAKMEQALAGLGVVIPITMDSNGQPRSIRERYQAAAEELQLYSRYPTASFWPQIYQQVQKLYPNQRRVILQELGLLQPNDIVSEAQVYFMFSHGAAAPGTFQLSPEAQAVLVNRESSKMAAILTLLDRITSPNEADQTESNPALVIAAAQFGIKLPWQRPKAALLSTIFLYEWLQPDRPLLATVLPTAKTSAQLLAVLRQYDDFELSAIWPGFSAAPRDRRELLQQLLQQLPRQHFTTAINCQVGQDDLNDPLTLVQTSFGTAQSTAKCWPWSQLINIDYAQWPRTLLYQLSRALARNDSQYAANQEDVVVSYLVSTAFDQVDIPALDPNVVDTEAIRLVLTALFQLGELAFGWDGASPEYKIERDQAQVELVPLAQNNLVAALANPGAIPAAGLNSYRFDDQAKAVAAGDLASLLSLAQAAPITVVAEHSIVIIQSAYIYLAVWFGDKILLNPFIFGA